MIVKINWNSFNDRRYSKPWIALVASWHGRPVLDWGNYLGSSSGGRLEVDANPGDIIRYGQKDLRKPNSSASHWAIVLPDGSKINVNEVQAADFYRLPVDEKEIALAGIVQRHKDYRKLLADHEAWMEEQRQLPDVYWTSSQEYRARNSELDAAKEAVMKGGVLSN